MSHNTVATAALEAKAETALSAIEEIKERMIALNTLWYSDEGQALFVRQHDAATHRAEFGSWVRQTAADADLQVQAVALAVVDLWRITVNDRTADAAYIRAVNLSTLSHDAAADVIEIADDLAEAMNAVEFA